MHPTMGTEMYRPEFPRRLYSALESSIDLATLGGSIEEVILREFGGQCWIHADDVPKTLSLEDSCMQSCEREEGNPNQRVVIMWLNRIYQRSRLYRSVGGIGEDNGLLVAAHLGNCPI